jgi:leucine dehydrogenase
MIFEQLESLEHEQVVFCNDNETGLKAIIAIHNTTLGPALGGTRIWKYSNEADALNDVLRLSRGMTYKSAISGIHLGGGKAVIIDSEGLNKGEAFWRRYGRFVNSLNGKYYTAEDVGTSPRIMEYIAQETKFVVGKPDYLGGSGDPSPVTAYGVYLGMKAAAKHKYGKDSLKGKKVAVQGAGHVGQYLINHLIKEGAKVLVCDINEKNLQLVTDAHKDVKVISPNDIYSVDAHIYAPCALGATVNDTTIPQMHFEIIAGAANNQLADEVKHGQMLREKGIIYAPDFLINAGGVCNCFAELNPTGYHQRMATSLTEQIYDRTIEILQLADAENIAVQQAAIRIAQARIDSVSKLKARM